eukprot:gnl/Spiro4/24772_TR12316_c0_g2_i1.p1 gnl/Spiro4/24772_TR12316_c0_g2~~gnl/Spiro4/24772_TR12316_c0_g2_i1.p1  ORF type:complete len:211 (-),score=13.39 gnl/Spiro4/24772_TR12316_c0_g2_i1:76-708(-)
MGECCCGREEEDPDKVTVRRCEFENGDVYDGEWKGKMMDGQGTYIYSRYDKSEIKLQQKHMAGGSSSQPSKPGAPRPQLTSEQEPLNAESFKDDPMNQRRSHMYKGSFRAGQKHGHGVEHFLDGTRYVGMFENNKRKGHGNIVGPDGIVYEGEWDDNFRHGQGKLIYPGGTEIVCKWKNDLPVGEAVLYDDNDPEGRPVVFVNGRWQSAG